MLRTIIQVLSLSTVLLSSFFLIKGVITSKLDDLVELSRPRYGYHTGIASNLVRQRTDTTVGFVLLLLSFLLQTGNLLWPMRIDDFAVNKLGVIVGIVVTIILFFLSKAVSDTLYKRQYRCVENKLKG